MLTDCSSLSYPLHEDVLMREMAGDLEGAIALIDYLVAENRTPLLNDRLLLEKQRIERLPADYPLTREEALAAALEKLPGFTEADFDELEMQGDIQYKYIHGEKRYFESFLSSLLKLRGDVRERFLPEEAGGARPVLDDYIREVKEKGTVSRRIRIRHTMTVDDAIFRPGRYLVHLPLPQFCAQQHDIEILAHSEGVRCIDDINVPARTICFDTTLTENRPFFVEYAYTSTHHYFSENMPVPASPLYPFAGAVTAADVAELPGHIVFTPYLRALASDICKGENNPLRKARKIYDYVTENVRYSFMRSYFVLPQIPEYCAAGLKGDCGVQALLFITLCRIAGIPARWQSSASFSDGKEVGSHDWAQFYVKGWGWLFADPSFGGSAYRAGNKARHDFYFGNLDPYRMIANSAYQQNFTVKGNFMRNDPYDSQRGECEDETRNLLYDAHVSRELISIE